MSAGVSRELVRDGVVLRYEQRGSGPLVALVQGLGLPAGLWLGLPFGLARAGYCVVTPDNRGAGRSDAPDPPYEMATLAADLAAILSAVDGGPALVVGISLGGMIVQQLALDHPQLVAGIVLAASSCGPPVGLPPSERILSLLMAALTGEIPLQRVYRYFAHPESLARRPELFREWDRLFERDPRARPTARGLRGQLAAAAAYDGGAQLARIHCPAEVLTGDADRVIPPRNSEILAERLPDSRLTVVERAGHAFPLEHPRQLPLAIDRLARRAWPDRLSADPGGP